MWKEATQAHFCITSDEDVAPFVGMVKGLINFSIVVTFRSGFTQPLHLAPHYKSAARSDMLGSLAIAEISCRPIMPFGAFCFSAEPVSGKRVS